MEYLGGTYVSQVTSAGIDEAMRLWLKDLPIEEIPGFSLKDKEALLLDDFEDEEPAPLTGIINVWYFLVSTEEGIGRVNAIRTDQDIK
jgi:hypothetical protein